MGKRRRKVLTVLPRTSRTHDYLAPVTPYKVMIPVFSKDNPESLKNTGIITLYYSRNNLKPRISEA